MDKIFLSKPIMINAQSVQELTYDTEKITAEMFCQADAYKSEAQGNKAIFSTYELDSGLHLYLGMMAVIAENPHIDIKDLERVTGQDLVKFISIGRNFILGGVKGSVQKTSAEQSETMPEPSEQAQEN
jgi:hypothetical protein